jgi:hypothetical protein
MRNRFDRAAKGIFAEALAPIAEVSTEVETSPDPQSIDVWVVPRTGLAGLDLGLLGRIASGPCLIESYSGTVRLDEVRDCVRKQLGRHRELANKEAGRWSEVPSLWILSTGKPQSALELGFRSARGWPLGIYSLAAPWRVFLAVRCELPRQRDTLILRATGTGRVLREAVEDLRREPEDSAARGLLTRHLVRLQLELRQNTGGQTLEEKEFAMTGEEMLRELETKARAQGLEQGLEQGRRESERALRELETKARAQGLEEGARRMVRTAFERRFGALPPLLDEALGRIHELGELERLMAACISESQDEIARLLRARVH